MGYPYAESVCKGVTIKKVEIHEKANLSNYGIMIIIIMMIIVGFLYRVIQ